MRIKTIQTSNKNFILKYFRCRDGKRTNKNGHFPHKLKYVRHAIMALKIARDVTSGGPHGSQTFAFCIQVNGNDTVF